MPSAIHTFLPLNGDPLALVTVFEGDPDVWMSEPRRDGAADRWLVALHAGALRRTVRLRVGSPWRSGDTRWRSLSWDPVGAHGETTATDRLLPSFDGELGLYIDEPGQSTLVLDGRYQPPGGRLGTAVDTIALHRLARLTTTSFVSAVAAELGAVASSFTDSLTSPDR